MRCCCYRFKFPRLLLVFSFGLRVHHIICRGGLVNTINFSWVEIPSAPPPRSERPQCRLILPRIRPLPMLFGRLLLCAAVAAVQPQMEAVVISLNIYHYGCISRGSLTFHTKTFELNGKARSVVRSPSNRLLLHGRAVARGRTINKWEKCYRPSG